MPAPQSGPAGGLIRSGGLSGLPARLPAGRPPPARRLRRPRRRGVPLTLYLYLSGEILTHFAVALVALILLYVTVVAFQLVRDGIRLGFVWPHLLRTVPYPLFFSLPLALLTGITVGVGRMASDRELSALRAQGVSHLQVLAPILGLAVIFTALNFYLTGWVLPGVHYEHSNLRETILYQLNHLGSGRNRTLLLPGNTSLWVKEYDGLSLKGIVLDISRRDRAEILGDLGGTAGEALRRRLPLGASKLTLIARQCDLQVAADRSRVLLDLQGVNLLVPEEVSGPRGRDVFHQKFSIDRLPLPLSFARRGESARDLPNGELARWIRRVGKRIGELEQEVHALTNARASFAGLGERGSPAPALATASAPAHEQAGGGAARAESALAPAVLPESPGAGPTESTAEGGDTLAAARREVSSLRRRLVRAEIEQEGRFAFSLACLTFPLVAFSLVVVLERQSRLTHFFLGNLAVVALFFPLLMAGQVAAEHGWPAGLTLAMPNVVLGLGAAALLRLMFRR